MKITELLSGGAMGVDRLGEQYAIDHNIPIIPFWANWREYGKSAGPIRNRQMAEATEGAIILWDGKSRGTMNMIENLRSLGKPYVLWNEKGERLDDP